MPQVIFTVLCAHFLRHGARLCRRRMRTIDNHHVGEINALVMDFALPASLFASTGSAPRGEMMAQGPLFAILGAVMLIIYLLWYLFERKALRRSRGEAALQALTVALPNYAGIGLPIASTVLGPTATVSVAVALAAGSILVSPFTLMLLELSVGKGQNDAENLCRTGAPGSAARVDYARRPSPRAGDPALAVRIKFGYRRGSLSRSYRTDGGRRGAVPDGPDLVGPVAPPGPAGRSRDRDGQRGPAPAGRRDRSCASDSPQRLPSNPFYWRLRLGFLRHLVRGELSVGLAQVGSTVIASTAFSIVTLAITIAVLFP